jgi:hypothetical protein
MGFNRRKLGDQRREAAKTEAASRRATDAQVLEDAGRLIAAWNERQAKRMPMLFSPTIGAAITAGYWFLWVRCPACRTRVFYWLVEPKPGTNVPYTSNSLGSLGPDRSFGRGIFYLRKRSRNLAMFAAPRSPADLVDLRSGRR